MMIAFRLKLIS